MKPANFAPVYACLYPELAEIARSHGYAMAVHGSMARDFDLICVPWADTPGKPEAVVDAIISKFAIRKIGELTPMKHGRMCQTISLKFGEAALDLSFMPVGAPPESRLEKLLADLAARFPDIKYKSELPEVRLLRELDRLKEGFDDLMERIVSPEHVEQYAAKYKLTLDAIHSQKSYVPEIENLTGEFAIRTLVQLLVGERQRAVERAQVKPDDSDLVPAVNPVLPNVRAERPSSIPDARYTAGWNEAIAAIQTLNPGIRFSRIKSR